MSKSKPKQAKKEIVQQVNTDEPVINLSTYASIKKLTYLVKERLTHRLEFLGDSKEKTIDEWDKFLIDEMNRITK